MQYANDSSSTLTVHFIYTGTVSLVRIEVNPKIKMLQNSQPYELKRRSLHCAGAQCKLEAVSNRLGRNVDVVDHESSSTAAVSEVGKTENGDSDVAKFAVDESDTSDQNSRQA